MIRLGVNIDHVATLRNARGGMSPEPLMAAGLAQLGGADQITVHLREDRRHISDRDVRLLCEMVHVDINLEMAATTQMIDVAGEINPKQVTIVPEKREELTTEGGLDVAKHAKAYSKFIRQLRANGHEVILFVDPDLDVIKQCQGLKINGLELHTGRYADAANDAIRMDELKQLEKAANLAKSLGYVVNAGHGLNYHNVMNVAKIPELSELNIGHAIVARALWCGFEQAVREMKELMYKAVSYER